MRNISHKKLLRKSKHIFCSKTFLHFLLDNVEKYVTAEQAKEENIIWFRKMHDTDTHSEYVKAYCCTINSVLSKMFYDNTQT